MCEFLNVLVGLDKLTEVKFINVALLSLSNFFGQVFVQIELQLTKIALLCFKHEVASGCKLSEAVVRALHIVRRVERVVSHLVDVIDLLLRDEVGTVWEVVNDVPLCLPFLFSQGKGRDSDGSCRLKL